MKRTKEFLLLRGGEDHMMEVLPKMHEEGYEVESMSTEGPNLMVFLYSKIIPTDGEKIFETILEKIEEKCSQDLTYLVISTDHVWTLIRDAASIDRMPSDMKEDLFLQGPDYFKGRRLYGLRVIQCKSSDVLDAYATAGEIPENLREEFRLNMPIIETIGAAIKNTKAVDKAVFHTLTNMTVSQAQEYGEMEEEIEEQFYGTDGNILGLADWNYELPVVGPDEL